MHMWVPVCTNTGAHTKAWGKVLRTKKRTWYLMMCVGAGAGHRGVCKSTGVPEMPM